jgi:two-component system, cell cycle response regulator
LQVAQAQTAVKARRKEVFAAAFAYNGSMSEQSAPTGTVLVLDADRPDATIAARILTEAGHEVEVCHDKARGIELLESGAFDMVVVDPTGEAMGGLLLLEELRRAPTGWAMAPTVIVTGKSADAEMAVRALHAGAADFVTKPFSSERLFAAVERVLERKALMSETSRLRRDLSLFAAGQQLLETLDEKQLASRGLGALSSFAGASAALALGPAGPLDSRGLSDEEVGALTEARLPLHWSLRVDPACLSPVLARFPDALLLDCGEERFVVLLKAADEGGGRFGSTDEENALFLARHLATGFKNAARYVRAEQQARRDPLTGLLNAHAFLEAVGHAILRATLEEGRHCLLFLDLDHFKEVNDTHGHLMGSQLLVELSHVLRRCVRDSDVVARYGGDEFVILLSDAPLPEAMRCAERIRAAVHDKTFLAREGGPCAKLSVCIGVAAYPEHGADARTLLNLADRAMYASKAAGRNAVHAATASPEGG